MGELSKFERKRVIITTNTDARYSGVFHTYSTDKIALVDICILRRKGGATKSGSKEGRIFPIKKIKLIELEESC